MPRKVIGGVRRMRRSQSSDGQLFPAIKDQSLVQPAIHLHDRLAIESIVTTQVGSGRVSLHPHLVSSPLCSASLLANQMRAELIRAQETVTPQTIRRLLSVSEARHSIWNHQSSQEGRAIQLDQIIERLNLQEKAMAIKCKFNASDKKGAFQLQQLQDRNYRMQTIRSHLEPVVKGSLHPDGLFQGHLSTLTATEQASLPSPIMPLRGLMIRIRGPRAGNRAMQEVRRIGRASVNSVGLVSAEEAQAQLPSKLGTFGLYLRLVWGKQDRLVSPLSPLNCLDCPNERYSFI